jgi:hypothetical protein
LAVPVTAQQIDPVNKFAWGENVGFINWADAPAPATPFIDAGFLSGFIWGENIGWINLGNGNGPYANTTGLNFGVNISGSNNLFGFAWGENVGWINFAGGALATPSQPARIDFANNRFRGFVWGENIGWINLDDQTIFVGIGSLCPDCAADYDGNGGVDGGDLAAFFSDFEAGESCADVDGNGGVDGGDLAFFFSVFEAGGC